jgi:hypothetical protein
MADNRSYVNYIHLHTPSSQGAMDRVTGIGVLAARLVGM